MAARNRPATTLALPIQFTWGGQGNWWLDVDPADGSLVLQAVSPTTGEFRNVARLDREGNLDVLGFTTSPGSP
jgi:hypothetical protein